MTHPQTWVEVDLAAYGSNVDTLKRLAQPECLFMAVVKADGYGHGAVQVARQAIHSGADWLGVARLEEAVELRRAGLDAPILIFGPTAVSAIDSLLDLDLAQAIFTRESATALALSAAARGKRLRAHLKIDTGMGRLGLPWIDAGHDGGPAMARAAEDIEAIAGLDGLTLEGLFTHFASADSTDKTYTELQLRRFHDLTTDLERRGLEIPIKHAANSAALLDLPGTHLDMVRAGIATYGLYPSAELPPDRVNLRPVLQWKTRIIQIKRVPAGFAVSYGTTYKTPGPTTLATVAVGYADGLSRLLSSKGQMLVAGRRMPIVGRVCMDLTVLDLGEINNVSVDDEVVIIGRQGDEELTVDDMASTLGTINYEIVTAITGRVPRVYST